MRWMLALALGGIACVPQDDGPEVGAQTDTLRRPPTDAQGTDARRDGGAALGGIQVDIRSVAPCNCRHDRACVRRCPPADGLRGGLAQYDERFWEVRFYLTAGGASEVLGWPAGVAATAGPTLAGACRDDRLFVHFPLLEFDAIPMLDLDAVRAELAAAMQPWWFMPAGAEDPRPERERDWLRVEPNARCHVVDALRAVVDRQVPGAKVGRVCEFTPQLLPEGNVGPIVDWHLRRIDGRVAAHADRADAPPSLPGLPAEGAVDVLLFDSGWTRDDEIALRLTQRAVGAFTNASGAVPSRHGALMGALIRQVTGVVPNVRLRGWRVMDETGRGTTHGLASALVDALHVQDRDAPAVINLSLGWPAGLNVARSVYTLTEDARFACGDPDSDAEGAVVEDPAGEAVRHLLSQARAQGLVVFASSGNRPGRDAFARATPIEDYGAEPPVTDDCLAKLPNPSPWFFPAEWGYTPSTCALEGNTVDDQTYDVVAVAGTDWRDRPGRFTLAETPLVAPGEQVFVGTGGAEPVIGPRLVSGSSAATALVSGAAARLQILRQAAEEAPLTPRTLARLLWLTGDTQPGRDGRVTTATVPVNRLSVCNAEISLACGAAACPAGGLVGCLEQDFFTLGITRVFDQTLIDGTPAVDGCGACVDACRDRRCAAPIEAPAPDAAGLRPLAGCFAGGDCPLPEGPALGTPTILQAAADADPLPFELVDGARPADAHELGGVGPQPFDPSCPNCPAEVSFDAGKARVTLHALLDEAVFGADLQNPKATLLAASLVVERPDGSMAWASIYADGVDAPWKAGQYVKIADIEFDPGAGLDSPAAWAEAKAMFVSTVRVEQGKQAGVKYVDESLVPLKVLE